MDIRRLQIFLEVVDQGGFTPAGDVLEMSQPAVSQAIRELEGQLEVRLFHRLGRSVSLTPAGEALVSSARQVRRDLEIGRAIVRDVAGVRRGHLTLACLPTLAISPLAPIVGAYRKRFPNVTIALSAPENSSELLEFVRSGRSEVGIVDQTAASGLVATALSQQDFLVVLPPGSVASKTLSLAELSTMALVAAPPGSSTRDLLDDALMSVGARASVVVEAAQREALLPLILAGAGASLLPRPLAEVAETLGCVISEPTPRVVRAVSVVQRDGPLTPAASRFVEIAAAGEIGQPLPKTRPRVLRDSLNP